MKYRHLLSTAAALLLAGVCSAQTGILDPDAAYRKLPPRSGRTVLANQYTNLQQPGQPGQQGQQAPRRQRYYPVESDSIRVDAAIDSLNTARSERPVAGTRRKGDKPVLFLVGDSTMRTEVAGNGDNGQWGWGYYIENWFDTDRITVENHALGGESTRSWFKNYLFPMLRAVRPGDWVILQLGHNDRYGGGEMNSGRFRGILPGTGKEFTEVILPGNGTRERVYTYGEYLRIYIDEIRAKGAHPLLLSLTSRSGRGEDGKMVPDRNTEVIRTIAEEKGVPFIDFNAAIRHKFDEVFDSRKVDYLFFSDGIHASSFGAVINAETFAEELRKRPDIGLSSYLLPEKKYESAARQPGKPVIFVIGDSTGKIDNSEVSGQVGWGQVFADYVNPRRATVDNHAKAGRSARTFLNEGRWNVVYESLQPGDFVLIQFGHNDGGPINVGKARGELPGNTDEKQVMTREADGINEGIYTYGWYLRKFCLDAQEKGAIPIILSLTPGNYRDENGRIKRESRYKGWAKEAASQVGAAFVDLNEISAAKLDKMTPEQAAAQFQRDPVHSSELGARRNAKSVSEGLKRLKKHPISKLMK
ncbi:MAG: rhamnogalacturonan acetylesterase [Bacteroidales bacterium]|nr:rhamnogalacturonan acetylesterase [Bacteroidales bacterium]